jgi:hypothetical protein
MDIWADKHLSSATIMIVLIFQPLQLLHPELCIFMMDAILNCFKLGAEGAEGAEGADGAEGARDLLTTLF